MASKFKPARKSHREIAIRWPAEFHREARDDKAADAAPLWERHFAGDSTATAALFTHFAYLVPIVVARCIRRAPDFYRDPFEDLMGDGAIGLWSAIACQKPRPIDVFYFDKHARRLIRKRIFREALSRNSGGSHYHEEKKNIVARQRARF